MPSIKATRRDRKRRGTKGRGLNWYASTRLADMSSLEVPGTFRMGARLSVPVALGYFVISFAFGLYWAQGGLPPVASAVMSATNLSSSGQFAGLNVILAGGAALELALTTILVNLRYVLMSFSLGQRLDPSIGTLQRLAIGYGITDEVFALAMTRPVVRFRFFLGLMAAPVLGWTGGSLAGALVGDILPASVQSAAGILLYAMFIAIVLPPARGATAVQAVVATAAIVGLLLGLADGLAPGWRIILAAVTASAVGATIFPVERP